MDDRGLGAGLIAGLPLDLVDRVDGACDEFEGEWRAGRSPRIETYLDRVPDSARSVLLRELLLLEVELSGGGQAGSRPSAADYRERFPDHARVVDAAFEETLGDAPASAEASATAVSGDAEAARETLASDPKGPLDWASRPAPEGYLIEGVLGSGGMGVVYRARQLRLNRVVALKMIRSGAHAAPEDSARIRAEAKLIARFQHPNIVQVHAVGEHEGQPYFEMEYVSGGSLASRLGGRPQPPREAARLLEVIARAVHEAHLRGIVHRDLKPSNVLLTDEGVPKIADFGLAKIADEDAGLTRSGSVIGSPGYMAPEQASGRAAHVGPPADTYALGALFYELLTGRPPFAAPTVLETLDLVRHAEPVPPSRLQPGLPRDVETICLKCLEKDPARRYGSAEALSEDLHRHLADLPIRARRIGPAERLARLARRNRTIAVASAIILGLLLAGTVGLAVAAERSRRDARAQASLARQRETARIQADRARREADAARRKADAALRKAQETLTDMYASSGLLAVERDDPAAALLWFANAARLARDDVEGAHDRRIAARSWGRQARVPLFAHKFEDRPLALRLDPTGERLFVIGPRQDPHLWDWRTGEDFGWLRPDRLVSAACWSPDGRELALGLPDGSVEVRSVPSGEVLGRIEPRFLQTPRIGALAYRPDGALLALGNDVVRLWDRRRRCLLGVGWEHDATVRAIAFEPRSDRVATASDRGHVRVFAIGGGDRPLFDPVPHRITVDRDDLRFVDRGLLTIPDGGQVVVRDPTTGRPAMPPIRPGVGIVEAAISPDGRYLAVGGWLSAEVWDLAEGQRLGEPLEHGHYVTTLAFTRGGRALVSGGLEFSARVWDLPAARSGPTVLRHQSTIARVVASLDERHFATSQSDGLVRVWEVPGRPRASALTPSSAHRDAKLSGDGRYLVETRRRFWNHGFAARWARVFDVSTGEAGPYLPAPGTLRDAALGPDGRVAATVCEIEGAGELRFWDARAGRPLHRPLRLPSPPSSVNFSPDGTRAAAFCRDGEVVIAEVRTGALAFTLRHRCPPIDVAPVTAATAEFAPDGRTLVTVALDSTILVWDLEGRRPRHPPIIPAGECLGIDIAPGGRWLSVATRLRNAARVYDLETGRPASPEIPHSAWVHEARFHPSGGTIFTSTLDGQAQLWDWRKGRLALPSLNAGQMLMGVEVTPDGRWGLTTGRNGQVQVWSLRTGRPLVPPVVPSGDADDVFNSILVTPDGRYAVMGRTGDRLLRLDLAELDRIGSDGPDLDELCTRGEVASGDRLYEGRVIGLTSLQWMERWRALDRNRPPALDAAAHAGRLRARAEEHLAAGEPSVARLLLDRAREDLARAAGGRPEDPSRLRELLRIEARAVTVLRALGEGSEASTLAGRIRARLESLANEHPDDPDVADELARLLCEEAEGWTVLYPTRADSAGGATLRVLADGSVLAGGKNPDHDHYTLEARAEVPITGLRLETLPDPRLARGGAGRFAENGNFHVSEWAAWLLPEGSGAPPRAIGLRRLWADCPPANRARVPASAADGNRSTWWEIWPRHGEPHRLIAEAEPPAGGAAGGASRLRIALDSRTPYWTQHGLGRFRLSATAGPRPAALARWEAALPGRAPRTRLAAVELLSGRPAAALATLRRAGTSRAGDEAIDALLAALAHERLGQRGRAAAAFGRASDLLGSLAEGPGLLRRFREAVAGPSGEQPGGDLASSLARLELGRRWATLDEAVALAPKAAAPLLARAEFLAQRGRWREASADLGAALALEPDDLEGWCRQAALLLELGDTDGLRRVCRALLARYSGAPDPAQAGRAAEVCLISARDGAECDAACRLADRALGLVGGSDAACEAWLASGFADLRRGHFDSALARADRMLTPYYPAGRVRRPARLLRATALAGLGNVDEAKRALAEAVETPRLPDGEGPGDDWAEGLFARHLRKEAEALLLDRGFPADPFTP